MEKLNPSIIIDQLFRHSKEIPRLNVFTILDAARDGRIYRELGNFNCEYLCLFTDRMPDELARSAPYLVKLEKDAVFTKWLIKNGWGNNWGIFALAPYDLFDAIAHFRKFVKVMDEQDHVFFFRYYDPRVMQVYLPTCISKELSFVFGKVKYFLMEDMKNKDILEFSFDKTELITQSLQTGFNA